MRRLRPALLVLTVAIVIGVLGSLLAWHLTATSLPVEVEHASQVETLLRQVVESERFSKTAPLAPQARGDHHWQRPKLADYPLALLQLYLVGHECVGYLETPKESPPRWAWRLALATLRRPAAGAGRCEYYFARRLAVQLARTSAMAEAALTDRVRSVLPKADLLALDLSTTWYERGVVGVEAASRVLLQRELSELSLAETAELAVAMPPFEQWGLVYQCGNQAWLRQQRDTLLENAGVAQVLPLLEVRAAQQQPLRCAQVKR